MLLVSPMCLVGFVRDGYAWQWLAMGMGGLVAATLFHVYLAWWRDRFELSTFRANRMLVTRHSGRRWFPLIHQKADTLGGCEAKGKYLAVLGRVVPRLCIGA